MPGGSEPFRSDANLATFDRMLAELATGFIDLARDAVDAAVAAAQRRIGEALDLDRVTLWQFDPQADLVCRGAWTRDGVRAVAPGLSAHDHFLWMVEHVRAGEVAAFSRLAELPDVVDRDSHARLGTRSSAAVPLAAWGRLEGALTFDVVRDERQWTRDTLDRLRLAATLLANVLARRRRDEILRTSLVPTSARLEDVERQHIASVLEATRWRIRGEHGAAARLGLKPTTLETRMAKLGLHRPRAGP